MARAQIIIGTIFLLALNFVHCDLNATFYDESSTLKQDEFYAEDSAENNVDSNSTHEGSSIDEFTPNVAQTSCNAGLDEHNSPITTTQCIKLRQCMNILEDKETLNRTLNFCHKNAADYLDYNVCCPVNDFEKSREKLRNMPKIISKATRPTRENFELEECLERDHEYRHFSKKAFNDEEDAEVENGFIANLKNYQHIAAIGWTVENRTDYKCGGVLITTKFVLTAAHCCWHDRKRPDVIRLGDDHLKDITGDEDVQIINVKNITKHPQYKGGSHYNDIALIWLATEAIKSMRVMPACLHVNIASPSNHLETAGYGSTWFQGEKSNQLMAATLEVYNSKKCNDSFGNDRQLLDGIIELTQICAISVLTDNFRKPMDSCSGDSGGPLQYILNRTYDNVEYLFPVVAGLTNFGIGCAIPNQASVYIRIAPYIDWITSVVNL